MADVAGTQVTYTRVRFVIGALVVALAVVLLMATRAAPVGAFETGQVLHNGNPDFGGFLCTECHTAGQIPATVEITGPEQLAAGETGTFTVTVAGGPGVVGGFNASTTGRVGNFDVLGDDARLFFNEITHTAPKAYADGAASFAFTWTAPTDAQAVTLYAAGLAGNGDGRNSGDSVGSASFAITVTRVPGDVNGDLSVDVADVRAILLANVGSAPEGYDADTADINGDGTVSLIDALILARQIRG